MITDSPAAIDATIPPAAPADPGPLGGGKMDPAKADAVFGFPDYRNPKGEPAPAKPKRGRKGKSAPDNAVASPPTAAPEWPADPDEPCLTMLCPPELLEPSAASRVVPATAKPELSQRGRAEPIKSPYPYFGGKSRVAAVLWDRFGDVPNFVDPFCGSMAVLLFRPHSPRTETVNDACGWLVNFWRAVQSDPDAVARYADWPVSELDLHARGDWLFYRPGVAEWVERLRSDPDFFDAKSAGWWVWGACCWIGSGWGPRQMPHVGDAGRGVNRQMPHVGTAGASDEVWATPTGEALRRYMRDLAERTRRVRVLCGDWKRCLGPSLTFRHGTTAIVLDPPYGEGEMDYAAGGNKTGIAVEVRDWAVANGDNPDLRIAYCGYEGAVEFPASWECYPWKSKGGYGSQGDGQSRLNARRERVWFSPHCIKPDVQLALFGGVRNVAV